MPDRTSPVLFVAITQPGHSAAKRLDVTDSVLSLSFDDEELKAQKLSLTVNNYDLSNFDNPIWRKGSLLAASWGYVGDTTPTYECIIQSVIGFQTLTVEAIARSIEMHKVQRTRKWLSVKRSDVVQLVAAENGYSGDQLHLTDSVVVLPYVHQVRETDAQLLQRLARAEGWYFHVDYDGLHFHERKLKQAPLREYTWFGDPGRGDILASPNIENDVTAKPASITLAGRDPLAKTDYKVTADNTTPRESLAPAIELIDTVTGEATYQPAAGQTTIAPTTELNEGAALRKAQGQFRDTQLTTVKLTLPVVGDPRVRAKSIVKVNGLRTLSGNYYVTKAVDTVVASGGFTQTLSLRRDGRSEIFPKAAANPGQTNEKDPNTDTGKLEPLEQVDPVTGETTTIYVDSRGRGQE